MNHTGQPETVLPDWQDTKIADLERALTAAQTELAKAKTGPKCEDCGFRLARGELDRSGQEWWCPVCTKAGMRMAENKRLREELAKAKERCGELEKDAARYRWLRDDSVKHSVPAPTGTMRPGTGIKVIYDIPTVKVSCAAILEGPSLDDAIDAAASGPKER